jgi:hypothetical protein
VTALTTWVPWATSLGVMVTAQEVGRVFTGEQASKAAVSRDKGSRSERSRDRGRGVWPMTALVLAAAIALPLPAIHQTQGRECGRHARDATGGDGRYG